jgi:hypothetical protein
MSVSAAVKSRLLMRAREEAERAPLPERGRALVALARGGDPEDINRAQIASQGKDTLRAQLVIHLVKCHRPDEALSYLSTINKPNLRGFAAQELALSVTKERALEIPTNDLPPKYLANILFQAALKGSTLDPQLILRSRERVTDELERIQVVTQGSTLLTLFGRHDEAKRMIEALPPWAIDEYHCLVVEAYARSGRTDDARHYVRSLSEDSLRMECFLRHLEHTEDRVTAVLARSLLNLSKVPKSYSLKLARRTKAIPDLERAESYVWQELDDSSLYAALSFIELGEILSRSKEAERACEILCALPDTKDLDVQLCASRLAALVTNTQGTNAVEALLQALPSTLKKSALQSAIPLVAALGDVSNVLTLVSQLTDPEARVLSLVEGLTGSAKPEAVNQFQDRSAAKLQEKTPTPSRVELPINPEAERMAVARSKKAEEPNNALADLMGSPDAFEDDLTGNKSKRRRSATELKEIMDEVAPQASDSWLQRDAKDPSVNNTWEPASKPADPDAWKEPSPKPTPYRDSPPEGRPQLGGRAAPVLSSARVSVAQINARSNRELSSKPEYYTRPEPAIEEAKRQISRGEIGLQAEAARFVWSISRDSASLAEAKSACRGQVAGLRALGVCLAQRGFSAEARGLALEVADGEERGKILQALAKQLCAQNDFSGAEAEILYSAQPTARALVLVEISKQSGLIEYLEDAVLIASELPETSLRAKMWQEIALLYALASKPARALRFGGEEARIEIARSLGRANRREEAQRYLEIVDDPERRALGQIALVQPNQEDLFHRMAVSRVEAISLAKRQIRPALLLARASRLPADIARAKQLVEKHAERDTLESARDLLLQLEAYGDDGAYEALVSWFAKQRQARPEEAELVRLWAPLALQRDPSGKALVSAVEQLPEQGLRSIAAEAAARALAQANLQELASRVARDAIEPIFTAYGFLAIAAQLKNEASPVEYPVPSELFSH